MVVEHVDIVDGIVLVRQACGDLEEGGVFCQRLFQRVLLLNFILDVHDAHDQMLVVVRPEDRHARIAAAALPHDEPVGHRKRAVFLHRLQHRLLIERIENLLPVVGMHDGADVALGSTEEVVAGRIDVEFLIRLHGGELDICVGLRVDVVDHAVLLGQAFGDLGEDHVFLGDGLHLLLALHLVIDIVQGDDQVDAVVRAHGGEAHVVRAIGHDEAVLQPVLAAVVRDRSHVRLVQRANQLVLVLGVDHAQDVLAGFRKEVAALGRNLQLLVVVAGGILHVVIRAHVHVVNRGIAVRQSLGDRIVGPRGLLRSDRLIHIARTQNEVIPIAALVLQDAQGVIDDLAVDDEPVHQEYRPCIAEMVQERFAGQRLRNHLPVLFIDGEADVPLAILKEVLARGVQLELLVLRVGAVAFVMARLPVDIIDARIVDQQRRRDAGNVGHA